MTALDPILKRWPVYAVLASLAMLAVAHAFETFGHLAPCHLCLKQREVYWSAVVIAAAVWLVEPRMPSTWRIPHPRWLLVIVFAASFAAAAFHAGVEWKWWPGPTTCTGGGAKVTAADLAAMLNGTRAVTAPMCDKAAWVFAGLSMAGWNAVASLGLTALSVLSVRKAPKPA